MLCYARINRICNSNEVYFKYQASFARCLWVHNAQHIMQGSRITNESWSDDGSTAMIKQIKNHCRKDREGQITTQKRVIRISKITLPGKFRKWQWLTTYNAKLFSMVGECSRKYCNILTHGWMLSHPKNVKNKVNEENSPNLCWYFIAFAIKYISCELNWLVTIQNNVFTLQSTFCYGTKNSYMINVNRRLIEIERHTSVIAFHSNT